MNMPKVKKWLRWLDRWCLALVCGAIVIATWCWPLALLWMQHKGKS